MVVFSTFVAVCGSFVFGTAVGYSSPTETGIMDDLGISMVEQFFYYLFYQPRGTGSSSYAFFRQYVCGFFIEAFMGLEGFESCPPSFLCCHVQYSLYASLLTIGGMIGAVLSGRVADVAGRKYAMGISEILCIIGWLAESLSKVFHSSWALSSICKPYK
ncbi:hypothetical protein SLEP1_g25643 [Rubroshorea leprosula]|uniref:Major facilitator superfamily (MFS) profile domain-containing protein n=1 Tax=Rubroshorea leprosula TaxID=152421 RepID=A0AAV5JX25_9ROSI|nr:hypothetical protein SLEP1_g25643 [Rubroshorea leprosula]